MKKLLVALMFLPCLAHAGTITTSFSPLGTVTFSSSSAMSIALDSTTASFYSGVTQVKYNMTNNAGNFMYCAMGWATGTNINVSSVSYNGQQFSVAITTGNTNGPTACALWYLSNPAIGSNSVQVNFPTSVNTGVTCATLTGVNAASPIDVSGANVAGSGTGTITQSVTTSVLNDWLVDCSYNNNGNAETADPAQTAIFINPGGAIANSYRGPVGVGSSSMTYTASNFSQPAMAVMAVKHQ